MSKYIVCGGRDFYDAKYLYAVLDYYCWSDPKERAITEIVVGGAPGADTLAQYWALHNNIEVTIERADWQTYGKAAGPIRNKKMLEDHPDAVAVIAFLPGGPGTRGMIELAKARGFRVHIKENED